MAHARPLRKLADDYHRRLRLRPVQPHPDVAQLGRSTVEWARRHLLVGDDLSAARLAAIGCGNCAAHTYPTAPTEVAQLGADLIAWLFLFDDRVAEGRGETSLTALALRIESHLAVFDGHAREGEPFDQALLEIIGRARSLGADDGWVTRFRAALNAYAEGCLREFEFRRHQSIPSLDEYRRVRTLSIGTFPVFCVIELLAGRFLTEEEAYGVECTQARALAARLCAWVNDAYSYAKERGDGDPMNLIAVLSRHFGISEDEAFDEAAAVFNLELEEFETWVIQCADGGISMALRAYFDGLADWLHGNAVWTTSCGRYQ